jgi:hypothetical protein
MVEAIFLPGAFGGIWETAAPFDAIATNRRQDEQDLQDGSGFCFGSVTVILH